MVAPDRQKERLYEVGYKKPPKATQFKPGDRGNPKGRPRGSLNQKTIIETVLAQKLPVRKGDKTVKLPALQVIAETFTVKAAQGDHRALNAVVNLASKSGTWGADRGSPVSSPPAEAATAAREVRPSDRWVESLDDSRLSEEEKIELSKLAERIDSGGDVMALSGDDFVRLKELVNKGRSKDAGPQADDELDQAA